MNPTDSSISTEPGLFAHPLHFLEALMLLILIAVAIASITELGGRRQLQAKIAEKYKELAEAHFRQADSTDPAKAVPVPGLELMRVRQIRDCLESLMLNGTWDESRTQTSLRWQLTNLSVNTNSSVSADGNPLTAAKAARMKNSLYPGWMDNSSLLAALVISCGALGSMIAGLRSSEPASFRKFFLGVATGFICYLLLVQADFLFLKSGGQDGQSSPVASALFSLLAGLYSNEAFEFFAGFFKRITAARKGAAKGNF